MQNSRLRREATTKAALFLLTILTSIFLSAFSVRQAHLATPMWTVDDDGPADFRSIQGAINAAQHGDSIYVKIGVYHEHVIVNRSVTMIGENTSMTIVDGGGSGTVFLVTANNVTLEGFTVRKGRSGIVVSLSQNCRIEGNLVEDNSYQGIFVDESQNCTVRHNQAVGTLDGYGINIKASQNILVEDNRASSNYYDGIGLLSSSESTVRGNTVDNNTLLGIWLDSSYNNLFYHNNLFGNNRHVSSNSPSNRWDSGSEGNYWSNYTGVDFNGDGAGDQAFIVDEWTLQQDRFPLMRPYVNEVYLGADTEPPVASFTYSPDLLFVNETASFDASESYDSVGKNAIVGYSWDFGDGAIGSGIRVDHTYLVSGTVTVVLSVVDVAGNEGYASINLPVWSENSGDEQPLSAALMGVLVIVGVVALTVLILWFKRKDKQPE